MGKSNRSVEKGQKSLTSFFAANLKKNLQEATNLHKVQNHEQQPPGSKEDSSAITKTDVGQKRDFEDTICIDLSPTDHNSEPGSEAKTSPYFHHQAKRAKTDHDHSKSSPYTASGEAFPVQDEEKTGQIGSRLVGGAQIPSRIHKTHEKFQVAIDFHSLQQDVFQKHSFKLFAPCRKLIFCWSVALVK